MGELAFQPIGQASEAGANVSDDLRLRKVYLLHSRRRGADMNDLRSMMAHQERGLLDGIMADRDNQVVLVDGLVNPIPFRQRGRAHIETGARVDGTLPHLSIEERNLAS